MGKLDQWFRPGQKVGNLRIDRKLGEGGFGTVYLAWDTLSRRPVALKAVEEAGGEEAERERDLRLREARTLARLSSNHVVLLYAVEAPDEIPAWRFIMEYVDGESLQQRLDRVGPLEPEEVRRIADCVASALRVAYDQRVVHGDIKPANVLLGSDGSVKLADFGLARVVEDISLRSSSCGEPVGTLPYMAPEVIDGGSPTFASDAWSFGALLYCMLAGRRPFEQRNYGALFVAIQAAEYPPLGRCVDPALVAYVQRCLSRLSSDRAVPPPVLPPADAEPVALEEQTIAATTGAPIGCSREWQFLTNRFDRARTGEGSCILIDGEAGVGKTHLVHQLRAVARQKGVAWVEADVTGFGGLVRPLFESIRSTLLDDRRGGFESEAFESAARIVLQAVADTESGVDVPQDRSLWAAEKLLVAFAKDHPLALFIEDAEEATAEDLRIVAFLARKLPTHGILFLLARTTPLRSRSDSDAAWAGALTAFASHGEYHHIELEPLSAPETLRLIESSLLTSAFDPAAAQRIFDLTQGVPLYTLELMRHAESIDSTHKSWTAEMLPQRFRDLVAVRIRALSEEDRSLVEAAAVDGPKFDGQALAAVLGEPLLVVLRRLQGIHRGQGLIVPAASGYRFVNGATQEVVYGEVAPELRRALHLAFAEHLEARASADSAESAAGADRLAWHWDAGGRADRAERHYLRAILEAGQRQEYRRAVQFANRCRAGRIEDLRALVREYSRPLFALAGCYFNTGRTEEASRLLEAIRDEAQAQGEEQLALKAKVFLMSQHFRTEGSGAVSLPELTDAADRLAPENGRGDALYLLGRIHKYRGTLEKARGCLERAARDFGACGLEGRRASALDQLAAVASRAGDSEAAEKLYAEAARRSRQVGNSGNAAISDTNRAMVAFAEGRLEGLDEILREAVDELRLVGLQTLAAHADVHRAKVLFAEGLRGEALAVLDAAIGLMGRGHDVRAEREIHLERAQLFGIAGSLSRARDELALARRAAESIREGGPQLEIELLAIQLDCWGGRPDAARDRLEALGSAESEAEPEDLLVLAESMLYGLEPALTLSWITAAASFIDPDDRESIESIASGLAALAREEREIEPLLVAASALREMRVGPRLCIRLALADLLEARAQILAERPGSASGTVTDALRRLRPAGHVWLARIADELVT